eukprot:9194138-Pyramimonas_sp.AAC.1
MLSVSRSPALAHHPWSRHAGHVPVPERQRPEYFPGLPPAERSDTLSACTAWRVAVDAAATRQAK